MVLSKAADALLEFTAVGIYVASLYMSLFMLPTCLLILYLLGPSTPLAWLPLAGFAFITLVPLTWTTGKLSERFASFSCARGAAYFPTKVIVADPEAFKTDRGYLCGFEPHSALPLALPVAFATCSQLLPKELRGRTHGLASSICFSAPLIRHLYWWLGVRPISRQWIGKLLDQKHIAVLVPGGVQEVLYMEHGKEVMYLSTRTGFVRLAIKHGAPLVPVFAFGQTRTYDWVRPGPPLVPNWLVERVSRTFGAVPIGMFGRYGSSMPHRAPMTVVIGRPIEVPQMDEPPKELVEQLLQRFIEEIKGLYERYKDKYGQGEELVVL